MSVVICSATEKNDIYDAFLTGQWTKTDLANRYGISTRTLGRVLDEVKSSRSNKTPNPVTQTKSSTSKTFNYFVVTDDNMISIIRVDPLGIETPVSEIAYAGTDRFVKAKAFYSAGDLQQAFSSMSKKHQIESLCNGKVTVYPEKGVLEFNDGPSTFRFSADLAERVVDVMKANDQSEVNALMNFANKLANNPSKRSIKELYKFLKATDIKIREDGMVMCFKKVRSNYFDVHSGTFDNSVGKVVSMPRSMVDDDSTRTCSAGLHVCSKSYLSHFGGERIMLCAVDPADFVSIPTDYNDAKARVCKYEVVEEVTGKV